jgi:hypothetical protein
VADQDYSIEDSPGHQVGRIPAMSERANRREPDWGKASLTKLQKDSEEEGPS